jgi:Ni/Fe-hydrogenase subunit HybB-like protein
MIPGIALAALTAIYTAYLFAQSKARDLWQNPLLPPQFVVHSILAGAAVLAPVAAAVDPGAEAPLLRIVAFASFLHPFPHLGGVDARPRDRARKARRLGDDAG